MGGMGGIQRFMGSSTIEEVLEVLDHSVVKLID